MCAYQNKTAQQKTVELILSSFSTIPVRTKLRMYVWATKYKLYHFIDSAYKLNAFIFAYKIVTAQYKDE